MTPFRPLLVFRRLAALGYLIVYCSFAREASGAERPVWLERMVNPASGEKSVRYRIYGDKNLGDDAPQEAVVTDAGRIVWKYEAPGHGLLFSWSPGGTALLVGTVHPERDQSLQVVLFDKSGARAVPIPLDSWREVLERELPRLSTKRRAPRSQVDFERVIWTGEQRLRFWYQYSFLDQAGELLLEVDLAKGKPSLRELQRTLSK